jgi:hypothetical protein
LYTTQKAELIRIYSVYYKNTEQVNYFNYLGCIISIFENKDLETKVSKFNHICGSIRTVLDKKIRKDIRIKFDKTVAIPALIYSSETWISAKKKKAETKRERTEMKFLRNVGGYTFKDEIRNTVIRNETKRVQLK